MTEQPPSLSLLHAIDHAIEEVIRDPAPSKRTVLLQLGGIRRGLFSNVALTTRELAALPRRAPQEATV